MDSVLLLPDGVVGECGRRDRTDPAGGDGVDPASGRHVGPRPHHVGDRRQKGLRRHGRIQFRGEQHFRRDSRVSDILR